MRQRQESVDQTRLRIAEATMRLHEPVGPAVTTASEVADLAGITRLTVHRQISDDEALVSGCAGHWQGYSLDQTPQSGLQGSPAAAVRLAVRHLHVASTAEPV